VDERSGEVVGVVDPGCQRLEPFDDDGIECRYDDPRDRRAEYLRVRGCLPGIQLTRHPRHHAQGRRTTIVCDFPELHAVGPRRKDRPTAPFPDASPCANCHPLDLRELREESHVSDVRHAGGEHEWLPAQLIHLVDQPSQPILEASVTMLRARCDGAGVVAFLLKNETSLTGLTDILVASEVTFADGPPQPRWASWFGGGSGYGTTKGVDDHVIPQVWSVFCFYSGVWVVVESTCSRLR